MAEPNTGVSQSDSSSTEADSGTTGGIAGSGAQYRTTGAEGINDIGQAEAATQNVLSANHRASTFDSFMMGHYGRLVQSSEQMIQNAVVLANAVNNQTAILMHRRNVNATDLDEKVDSVDLQKVVKAG